MMGKYSFPGNPVQSRGTQGSRARVGKTVLVPFVELKTLVIHEREGGEGDTKRVVEEWAAALNSSPLRIKP